MEDERSGRFAPPATSSLDPPRLLSIQRMSLLLPFYLLLLPSCVLVLVVVLLCGNQRHSSVKWEYNEWVNLPIKINSVTGPAASHISYNTERNCSLSVRHFISPIRGRRPPQGLGYPTRNAGIIIPRSRWRESVLKQAAGDKGTRSLAHLLFAMDPHGEQQISLRVTQSLTWPGKLWEGEEKEGGRKEPNRHCVNLCIGHRYPPPPELDWFFPYQSHAQISTTPCLPSTNSRQWNEILRHHHRPPLLTFVNCYSTSSCRSSLLRPERPRPRHISLLSLAWFWNAIFHSPAHDSTPSFPGRGGGGGGGERTL